MYPNAVRSEDIVANTISSSGTLITIPAGRWLAGTLSLSASIGTLAGTSISSVATAGTNVAPVAGSVLLRLNLTGSLLGTSSEVVSSEILVRAPDENDVTLTFTAGATGISSVSISGFFI